MNVETIMNLPPADQARAIGVLIQDLERARNHLARIGVSEVQLAYDEFKESSRCVPELWDQDPETIFRAIAATLTERRPLL